MAQNVPPLKAAQNVSANIAALTASPTKATPPRLPSNRLNRKASTEAPTGLKSPRRTASGVDGKIQGGTCRARHVLGMLTDSSSNCSMSLLYAERVKVVVRLRPPFAHETGGAVMINRDQNSISVFRE